MSEKGVLSKSIASNISEAIIDKLGGAGYAPTEWSENINLLGIASADIEEALASITEDTSSSDKGLLSLSIASDMGAMLNKKYNTSRGFKPSEVSSAVSALIPLPEKTTSSGSIVTFSDGADDVPLKSCEVALPPSLDGYSAVDVVSAGKNLLINNGVDISGSGLSFVVNGDKSVTISGVATANAFFTFFENVLFKASSYMIRGSGNSNVQIIVRRGTASGSNIRTASSSDIAWNLGENTLCACVIRVASGTDLTTPITVYPQIEVGSSLSDYETAISATYTASLGRTIYGGTVDVVKGEGTDENGNDFTFEPVEINSRLGNNTMWSDGGNTEVTYRADLDLYEAPSTLLSSNNTETEGNEEQEVNE